MAPPPPPADNHEQLQEGAASGMIIDLPDVPVNQDTSSGLLPPKSYRSSFAVSMMTSDSNVDDEEKNYTDIVDIDSVTYIDFVPPPPPPVPPPAKYKLWLLILILVYLGVWFGDEAQVVSGLTFGGWLAPHAALFLYMIIQISVSTYAALDLLVSALTFKINEKTYGAEAWLKMGRTHIWMKNTFNKRENALTDFLVCIVEVLEEGFEIFNPTDSLEEDDKPDPEFQKIKDECQVVLKIEHNVKCGYADKYEEWNEKIGRYAKLQPGFIQAVRERSLDEKEHCRRTHTVYITFESLQTLNDWMTSPIRQKLVDELTPWLESEDVVQLVQKRQLCDAFTDLLVRQGEFVPPRSPKKWKVIWLTSSGLFFTVLILEHILPYYYEKWGIINAHERLVAFLDALFSTFFVSYIMQPLLIMQFSHWLQRKQPKESDEREPWRTLNDGIGSIWIKLLITVAFFGGMGIKWALSRL